MKIGACSSCQHAQSKGNPKLTTDDHDQKMVPYIGQGIGYCAKKYGTSFMPRQVPDYNLPTNECWEKS
jgi:hypothetical protein